MISHQKARIIRTSRIEADPNPALDLRASLDDKLVALLIKNPFLEINFCGYNNIHFLKITI